ncbi:MAG: hypothetical protein GYB20_00200 [Oceanospirillales bacterium]|nr:hypothetical protein [Oceanospirillales bacterium]MBR9886107.1 hypothetical protein [Oceanospirillales bacterium]
MKHINNQRTLSFKIFTGITFSLLSTLSISTAAVAGDALEESASLSPLATHSLLMDVDRVGNHLIALGERGHILLSEDEGNSWQQVPSPVRVTLTAADFVDDKTGWVTGHDGVILKTQDGGYTWTKQMDGYQANKLMQDLAQQRLAQSEQALENATAEQQSELEDEIGELTIQLEDAEAFSDEGPSRPFLGVWFKNADEGIVVGAFGLILHTIDGGNSWKAWYDHIDNASSFHLNDITQIGDQLFIAAEAGTLYRSDDWGMTWEMLDSPYEGSFFGIIGDDKGRIIAYGLRGHAFQSLNSGDTWQKIDTGIDSSLFSGTLLSDGSAVLVGAAGISLHIDSNGRVINTNQSPSRLPFSHVIESKNKSLLIAGPGGIHTAAVTEGK